MTEAFWGRVVKQPNGCWEWQGARTAPGWHGVLRVDGRKVVAHRYAWELTYGPITHPSLRVLHTCDNPPCVNPDHLWLGTQRQNAQDASRKGRMVRVVRTHCKRGHAFEGNTYIHPTSGRRMCRTCHIDRAARWREGRAA